MLSMLRLAGLAWLEAPPNHCINLTDRLWRAPGFAGSIDWHR
jgi:hypothetical protein